MKSRYLPLLPVVVFLLIAAGCQSEVIDNSVIVDPGTAVSYEADVQPIFTSSCAGSGCHIGETTNGVQLTNFEQVRASEGLQYGGPIVIPGDAASSPIIDKITPGPRFGARMPLTGGSLTATEINTIRTWIDEGANDN